jgi:Na+-driven multidrug efflux pump
MQSRPHSCSRRPQKYAISPFLSTALTVSLICGAVLSIFYVFFTPLLLQALNVDPALRPSASSYIYWRGAIAWAALAQSVCLSVMMATRDAVTPLKIVALAALVNVCGDAALCVWPLQLGCAGAAAATSFATLFSCAFMVKALAKKRILPRIQLPSRKELGSLVEFTGPLLAITITRLGGFIAMQRTAMRLGVQSLAGYQLCVNLMMFFLLFGEPLSQLSQTKLPSLLDDGDGSAVFATFKSVSTLAGLTAVGIAAVAYFAATFGSSIVSSDLAVQAIASGAAPALFVAVATSIFAVAVDGAMLASRDFGFMLFWGLVTFLIQLNLLPQCVSVSDIFRTFTFRLGSYALAALGRVALGYGGVGRAIRATRQEVAI